MVAGGRNNLTQEKGTYGKGIVSPVSFVKIRRL